MMKKIAFYISNHGFGHASRNISIIQTLLKLDEQAEIYIKTERPQLQFMKQHLGDSDQLFYIEQPTDVGLVLQEGTLLIDQPALEEQITKFVDSWEELADRECEFFQEKGDRKSVV